MNKEQMELEKLRIELATLKKPWYLKPPNLISTAGVLLAFLQFQISSIKNQEAEVTKQVASEKMEQADYYQAEAKQQLAHMPVSAPITQQQQQQQQEQLATPQVEWQSQKQSALAYIKTDVWGFGVTDSLIQQARTELSSQGYSVGFGGLLDYKAKWLALTPSVFYYDKNALERANTIASQLQDKLGITFTVSRGTGLGVSTEHKANTFKIHIVEEKYK